ncbi:MAG: ATP-binding protein, partial [Alphaproteobacteria bacterium]
FLPRSLMGRSVLIIVAPLVLLQIVATYIFYERHWDTVTRRLASFLAGSVATTVQFMGERPDAAAEALRIAHVQFGLRATLMPGEILPNTPNTPPSGLLDRTLSRALTDQVRRPFRLDSWSRERDIEIDIQLPDGVLRVLAPREMLAGATTTIFILWMVGTSFILFAVAALFMRNQVRPIRRLAMAAESLGKGRDVPDFRPAGAREVRQAAAAFLEMRDRIMRQIAQRTDMLTGVSHDLRTPLTRMKLQLAMLGRSPEIAGLIADVSEMETMIEGYIAFARGEGGENPVVADVGALLGEVVAGAQRNGARIALECEGDLVMTVRPIALKRCLSNLVVNAATYGKHVAVHATRQGNAVEVTVDDDGPGIPVHQRDAVFRPFYRLDRSRNPRTGGVGLGLTIARDIVRGHGGDLTLGASPAGGLRAAVRLPV